MADNLSVSVTADTTDLRAKLAMAQADLRAYGAEVKTTATTLRTASEDMRSGLLVQLEQSSAKFNQAKSAANGFKSQLGETSGYRAAAQGAEQVATAHGHMGASAGVTREVLVMLHETMMGNYKRLAGSTVVLAERTNVLHKALGLIGPAFVTAAGAAAVAVGSILIGLGDVVARAVQAKWAIADIGHQSVLLGRDTQQAKDEATGLVDRLKEIGLGPTAAWRTAEGMATLTVATKAQRQAYADLVPFMMRATGKDAEEATKELTDAVAGGASGIHHLIDTYKLWDVQTGLTQRAQLKLAEDTKDSSAAAAVGLDVLNKRAADYLEQQQKVRDSGAFAAPKVFGVEVPKILGGGPGYRGPLGGPIFGQGTVPLGEQTQKAEAPDVAAQRDVTAEHAADLMKLQALNAQLAEAEKARAAAGTDAERKMAGAAVDSIQSEIAAQAKRADTAWEAKQAAAFDKIKQKAEDAAGSQKQASHDTLVAEEQFYTSLSKQADISAEHRQEAEHKAHMARLQLLAEASKGSDAAAKHDLETELGKLSEEQAANRDNYAKVAELENKKIALLTAAGAKYSVQLQAERTKQATMEREHAAEVVRIAESELARKRGIDDQDIAQRREELELEVATHAMSKAQEIAALQAYIAQKHAIDLADMNDELAKLKDGTKAHQDFYDEITKIQAKWATENKRLNLDAAQDLQRQWETALAPISGAFDQSLSGVIQGTQTLQQAVGRMAQSMVLSYAKLGVDKLKDLAADQLRELFMTKTTEAEKTTVTEAGVAARNNAETSGSLLGTIGHKLAQWLGLETAKTAATEAGVVTRTSTETAGAAAGSAAQMAAGGATIMNSAKQAAAGAYAAVSSIPFVGPVLAPAAAAVAFAAVMAFDTLTSFDKGSMNLPSDMVAQVHKGEMIIPAAQAAGLRARMAASGVMSSAPGGSFAALAAPTSPSGSIADAASGGDSTSNVSLHYNPIFHGAAPAGMAQHLRSQGDDFKSYLWKMTRNGGLHVPGRG